MKRIVALALCLVMVFGLMTGCQKSMDAKTLYQKMGEAMKNITAQSADTEMDLEMKMSTDGMAMTFGLDMAMNVQAKADLSAMYMDMNMVMKVLGESEETKMEMYSTTEDGAMVFYVHESTEDIWTKTSMDEYGDLMNQFMGMEQNFPELSSEHLTLAKNQETVNGRKCYVLTAQIDGAFIQEKMGDYMTQMTGDEGLDEETMVQIEALLEELDWSKLGGSVVYHVDDETFLPLEMSIEIQGIGDVFNGMIETLMAELMMEMDDEVPAFSIEIPTFKIDMKNMAYNDDVEIPAVPQEAIDNAIDADALMDDMDYSDVSGIEPQADGSYLLNMGGSAIRVMVPEGYSVVMADSTMIIGMSEDMMNYVNYMLMHEMTAEDMHDSILADVTWAKDEDFYKSHTDVAELNGFETMSLIYNDNTSIWYAWKELEGGVLVLSTEVEGESYDLASLIATVEIAVN